jgi:hypothetical protein
MLSTGLFLIATKKKRLIVFGAIRRFFMGFLYEILKDAKILSCCKLTRCYYNRLI